MKANELHYNGLYKYKADTINVTVKLKGWYHDHGLVFVDTDKYRDIDIDNLHPIPITPEWLKWFGFKSDNFTDEDRSQIMKIDNACGSFILDDEFILMDIDARVQIKHVHQLQNLYFAITSEELTTNN